MTAKAVGILGDKTTRSVWYAWQGSDLRPSVPESADASSCTLGSPVSPAPRAKNPRPASSRLQLLCRFRDRCRSQKSARLIRGKSGSAMRTGCGAPSAMSASASAIPASPGLLPRRSVAAMSCFLAVFNRRTRASGESPGPLRARSVVGPYAPLAASAEAAASQSTSPRSTSAIILSSRRGSGIAAGALSDGGGASSTSNPLPSEARRNAVALSAASPGANTRTVWGAGRKSRDISSSGSQRFDGLSPQSVAPADTDSASKQTRTVMAFPPLSRSVLPPFRPPPVRLPGPAP